MSSPIAVRLLEPNPRAAASSVPAFEARDRRVARFYEGALPGLFGPARDCASAAIHLGFWDVGTRNHREAAVNANRVLASKVGLRPGERVLDAGCGAGGSAVWLARELGARVVGVNLSPSQIHRARRLAHSQGVSDRVSFGRQDFAATTFPNEGFDVVWAQESVCHVEDKEPFLREASRLLKPGGRVVVADRFRCARPFGAEEEALLGHWLSGWAVPDLPSRTCPRWGSSWERPGEPDSRVLASRTPPRTRGPLSSACARRRWSSTLRRRRYEASGCAPTPSLPG